MGMDRRRGGHYASVEALGRRRYALTNGPPTSARNWAATAHRAVRAFQDQVVVAAEVQLVDHDRPRLRYAPSMPRYSPPASNRANGATPACRCLRQ